MNTEEYTQFIELYRKFNKKLDHICHIGFDKDLSYFDSVIIGDSVIELKIEREKQTHFIGLVEVIPIEILKYNDKEIKKFFIDKETILTEVEINHYKKRIQIAEENIEKLKTLKSLSYDISNDIIKSKHSVILNKSLIEEAEKRLNKYINHINSY
jgi:plasmid maintenance system killer protein